MIRCFVWANRKSSWVHSPKVVEVSERKNRKEMLESCTLTIPNMGNWRVRTSEQNRSEENSLEILHCSVREIHWLASNSRAMQQVLCSDQRTKKCTSKMRLKTLGSEASSAMFVKASKSYFEGFQSRRRIAIFLKNQDRNNASLFSKIVQSKEIYRTASDKLR